MGKIPLEVLVFTDNLDTMLELRRRGLLTHASKIVVHGVGFGHCWAQILLPSKGYWSKNAHLKEGTEMCSRVDML